MLPQASRTGTHTVLQDLYGTHFVYTFTHLVTLQQFVTQQSALANPTSSALAIKMVFRFFILSSFKKPNHMITIYTQIR
jgi:hypothetical protein